MQDMTGDLELLAADPDGPLRREYPSHDAYVSNWRLWRALRRDAWLTVDEAEARADVAVAWVAQRYG